MTTQNFNLIIQHAEFQSPHLSTDFVKLWLDGTPVEPNPSTVELDPKTNSPQYNMAFIDRQTLTGAIIRFDKMGLQVKMHAAAAGASRMVLDTIEQVRTVNPDSSLRHQLVHSSDIAPADRKRLAPLGVTADMSPDVWSWDKHGDSFPMKDLVETGALVTLGSDWPFPNISHSHPFRYLAEAMDRSKQGIDIETGIKMMTINGARAVLAAESADVDAMKTVFHEKAVAIGSILGKELIDTPESYFQFIRSRPSPQAVGENMITTITELKIDGDIARAQVEFANHWCTSGTNHLGLLKTQNKWKIISMMFWVRPSPPEVDQSMYPVGYCTDSSKTPAQRSDDT